MKERVTKEQIIQDLQHYYNKYNKIPTCKEYFKNGKHNVKTIFRKFGKWNTALKQSFNTVIRNTDTPSGSFECFWCHKQFNRLKSHVIYSNNKKSTKHNFCSSSCACSYNNTQRIKSRRSKIEIKLFEQLEQSFPNLKFLPNDKLMLDGLEVDIAVPSLKLAIEWNGIVHFKPIYGQIKLDKIKSIDQRKLLIAQQKDINLIVISDIISNNKIFNKAFKQISEIIKELLL